MIQFIVSIILFFVIFFGIAFILNMLLRRTWLMAFIYPFVVLFIVDNIAISKYFTSPGEAFSTAFSRLISITGFDFIILLSGFLGTIVSGFVIRFLRKSGYQMF
ncbi:YuiB family protein [Ornithinibacillus bavariensis]|uniref:Membrane protein YuiB n=1 Tax=Ornithinibacillus bavariensis TaxID=545502 RepID=A0A919XDR0_9BACI|nr:YuiB family protein [Ornithinibacillus bavariensis]GIO28623.1 putative membrane protein YuiB [Ornithinibacillus bavariensis]